MTDCPMLQSHLQGWATLRPHGSWPPLFGSAHHFHMWRQVNHQTCCHLIWQGSLAYVLDIVRALDETKEVGRRVWSCSIWCYMYLWLWQGSQNCRTFTEQSSKAEEEDEAEEAGESMKAAGLTQRMMAPVVISSERRRDCTSQACQDGTENRVIYLSLYPLPLQIPYNNIIRNTSINPCSYYTLWYFMGLFWQQVHHLCQARVAHLHSPHEGVWSFY